MTLQAANNRLSLKRQIARLNIQGTKATVYEPLSGLYVNIKRSKNQHGYGEWKLANDTIQFGKANTKVSDI